MNSPKCSFIVVAFYTKRTPYEREVRKLKKTCAKHNIPTWVVGIETLGDWVTNCAQKPKIIAQALDKHAEDVVYLDADARVMAYPALFDSWPADVGVHYLGGKELLSGTIFLKNNDRTRALVSLWQQVLELTPVPIWDQVVLQDCIREFGTQLGLSVRTLPGNYCQIEDTMAVAGKPIIKHTQASRKLKGTV